MRSSWWLAAAALLSLEGPVAAASTGFGEPGGWLVFGDENACGMSISFEGAGSTELMLGLATDGSVTLSATNSGWSARDGERYELVFLLDRTRYGGGKSLGVRLDGRPGFVTNLDPEFIDDFAKASGLTIRRGETVVDDLSLKGTALAVPVLRRCHARMKARADAQAREKARLAHIPADPFADVPGEGPAGPRPPRLIGGGYVSDADYPPSAIRAEEQGTSRARLDMGTDGRVTACTIIASSGSASLDAATCRILRSRARAEPARDAKGDPAPGSVETQVKWSLPTG